MMRLPKFSYVEPRSLEEACLLLAEHGPESKLIAGGTDLLPAMKLGLTAPGWLVSTACLPGLDQIAFDAASGLLRIGASVTLNALEKHFHVREKFPAIAAAAAGVGSPHLRRMGTVGGNLNIDTRCDYYNQPGFWRACKPTCIKAGGETCNAIGRGRACFAVFSGDLAPALIALDARVRLVSAHQERNIPLHELYTGNGAAPRAIKADEILVSVEVPPLPADSVSTYAKFAVRKAIDFPLAGVGVSFTLEGTEKLCRRVRVVMGAVGMAPHEVKQIPQLLEGNRLNEALIEEAAALAFKAARPVANRGSSPSYRKLMVKALVRKALRQAL